MNKILKKKREKGKKEKRKKKSYAMTIQRKSKRIKIPPLRFPFTFPS